MEYNIITSSDPYSHSGNNHSKGAFFVFDINTKGVKRVYLDKKKRANVIARLFHIHDYRVLIGSEKHIGSWIGRPLTEATKKCIKCGKEKTAHFIGI